MQNNLKEGRPSPRPVKQRNLPGNNLQTEFAELPRQNEGLVHFSILVLSLDAQKFSHATPTRQGKPQNFTEINIIVLKLTLVSFKRYIVTKKSLGPDSPVHPFTPEDLVSIRTWSFGPTQERWKGPYEIPLVTYTALRVEGIEP